jgi:DsbC/DsbD-like thiol-disulfide interchange protein
MKKLYSLVLFILAGTVTMAQSSKQVKWSFSAKKVADKTYEVHMTAAIGDGYHMYSQTPGADGPLPTSFKFTANPLAAVDTKVKENGKLVKKYESAWSSDVRYYEKSVDFIMVVKLKGDVKTNVGGSVEFMVCNESQCLPPSNVDFKVAVGG